MPPSHEITALLKAWTAGEEEALNKLVPLVHDELRRTARRYMAGERPNHTLQATALIGEVYLRLTRGEQVDWKDRSHFFAVCARLMRRILTDFARARRYQKRGGGEEPLALDEALRMTAEPEGALVALDDALKGLEALDKRKSDVVEMRFFGGLTVEETAEALGISPETVKRDWRMAKLWLLREMDESASP